MIGRISFVDPGNCSGLAVFDGAALSGCWLVEPEGVGGWGATLRTSGSRLLVIEHPILQKGDLQNPARALKLSQDLAGVNVIEGRWIQACGVPFEQVTPHDWKGSVPKGIMTARILERLTPDERALIPKGGKAHNAIDAIGLGAWWLRKKGIRR